MTQEWRHHPKLRGRVHAEHPDDVQVMVHDGGPRLTKHAPEVVWVTITGCEGDVFRGRVLNEPQQLSSVRQNSEIQFVVPEGGPHPLMVTEKYLWERPEWVISPCSQCGLTELFDAPSDLIGVVFPDAPAGGMEMFTAFCGACGGVQVVKSRGGGRQGESVARPAKTWWEFWK